MCLLFRRNHESDTQTDMANPERNEKQQETATSFECERSVGTDNGKGGKPLVMSPVTHLWTSEDDCRPLLRPEDATSTGMSHVYVLLIADSKMSQDILLINDNFEL